MQGLPELGDLKKKSGTNLPELGNLKKKDDGAFGASQLLPESAKDGAQIPELHPEDVRRAEFLAKDKNDFLQKRLTQVTDSLSNAFHNESVVLEALSNAEGKINASKEVLTRELTKLVQDGSMTEDDANAQLQSELKKVYDTELSSNEGYNKKLDEYNTKVSTITTKEQRDYARQKIELEKPEVFRGEGFTASAYNAINYAMPASFTGFMTAEKTKEIDFKQKYLEKLREQDPDEVLDDRSDIGTMNLFGLEIPTTPQSFMKMIKGEENAKESVSDRIKRVEKDISDQQSRQLKFLSNSLELSEKLSLIETPVDFTDGITFMEIRKLLGSQLPQMATAVLLPMAGSYVQEFGNMYVDNVAAVAAKENNLKEGQASVDQMIKVINSDKGNEIINKSSIAGAASASLDMIGIGALGKVFNPLLKGTVKKGLKDTGKKAIKDWLVSAAIEGVTEGVQGNIGEYSKANLTGEDFKVDIKKTLNEAASGSAVSLILGGAGVSMRQARQYFKNEKQITRRNALDLVESGDIDGLIVQGDEFIGEKLSEKELSLAEQEKELFNIAEEEVYGEDNSGGPKESPASTEEVLPVGDKAEPISEVPSRETDRSSIEDVKENNKDLGNEIIPAVGSNSLAMPVNLEFLKNLPAKAKKLYKKYLKTQGLFPTSIFKRLGDKGGAINKKFFEASRSINDLQKAINRDRKFMRNSATTETKSGKVTVSHKRTFSFGNVELSKTEKETFHKALQGDTKSRGKLSDRELDALDKMRQDLDGLTQQMIEEGVVTGDLAATFSANKGVYVHRSFQAFTDPKWKDNVPAQYKKAYKDFMRNEWHIIRNEEIDQQHESDLRSYKEGLASFESKNKDKLDNYASEMSKFENGSIDKKPRKPTLSRKKPRKPVKKSHVTPMTEEQITDAMYGLLNRAEGKKFISDGVLGGNDMDILKRKKNLPVEVRNLLGEHKDPFQVYAKSIKNMVSLLENQKFLTDMASPEFGQFFSTQRTDEMNALAFSESVFVENGMSPLYTTDELKEALNDTGIKEYPKWYKIVMKTIGTAKYSKTVLSPTTHSRNIFGNFFFVAMNGHWRLNKLTDLKSLFKSDESSREYIGKLIGLQILNSDVVSGELRQVVMQVEGNSSDAIYDIDKKGPIKRLLKKTSQLYAGEDNIFKIYAFENEKARYRKAYPNWTEQELDEKAAWIVRNTYPNYDYIPLLVKEIGKFPLMGTFVAFSSETLRVSKNTLILASKEMKTPETRVAGITRMTGIITAMSFSTLIISEVNKRLGFSDEDDEAVALLGAPWSKNSQILVLYKNGDEVAYIDLKALDPSGYMKSILLAMRRGETIEQGAGDALKEFLDPFISEDMLMSRFIDLSRNTKQNGSKVWEYTDTDAEKAAKISAHVLGGLEPGVKSQGERLVKGYNEEINEYGKVHKFSDELWSIGGIRISRFKASTSFKFKLNAIKKNSKDVFAETYKDIDNANRANEELIKEGHAYYKAAIQLGSTPSQLRKIMKTEAHLSDLLIRQIITGSPITLREPRNKR